MKATTHAAVCPFQFASHPGAALLLTRKMAAAAPDVRFTFFVTERSAKANHVSIDMSEGNIHFLRVDDGDVEGKSSNMMESMGMFMKGAGRNFRTGIDAAEKEAEIRVSCVISDAFLSTVISEIAEEKAAKWVAIWGPGATALAAHMYTDTLRRKFGEDGAEAETVDHYIPCFPAIPLSEIQKDVTTGDISSGISQILYTMTLKLPKAAAVAVNSCRSLESSVITALNKVHLNHKLFCVGPFPFTTAAPPPKLDEDIQGCLPWLDTHLSVSGPSTVAYISFGTAASPPTEELTALAKALDHAGVPYLWALPQAHHSSLPSLKGKVVAWAPQTRVLQHKAVGVHVSHGGWNSVLESLFAEVPMVCKPSPVADHALDTALVERVWGIGLGVGVGGRSFAAGEAAKAVESVLLGEEGRKMRERIKELKKLAMEDAHGSSANDFLKLMDIVTSKN